MRPQQLNLLHIFNVIMTEGSITRAAERLAMTQPAVSNAVGKMRAIWKDEVFAKEGRTIRPTVFAKNLWEQVRGPLAQLESAVSPSKFQPEVSGKVFRVIAPDITVNTIWPLLNEYLAREAPRVKVFAQPNNGMSSQALIDADCDLVLCSDSSDDPSLRSLHIHSPVYVLAMSPNHQLASKPKTPDSLARCELLHISSRGEVDDNPNLYAGFAGKEKIVLVANHFSSITPLLLSRDLITICPIEAIEREVREGKLVAFHVPYVVKSKGLFMQWHKRQDQDKSFIWLRDCFEGLFKKYSEQYSSLKIN